MAEKNMHLLLIHQAFVGPDEPGGTRHYELARNFIAAGHRFTIVASDLSYLTGKPRFTAKYPGGVQQLEGVRVLRAYTYPTLHRSFAWRIISFLSFMFTSVYTAFRADSKDVVMGTSPPIFQALSAWLVAKLSSSLFLLEIRDLWPEFAIGMGVLKNPTLIWLSRRLEAFLYSQAGHIIVNSPAYRDYLIKAGVPLEKVSLISNGVDTQMFTPSGSGERMRSLWGVGGKFVVTYAGALGMANDIPTVLKAAEHLLHDDGIHFILIGDGKEREKLEKLAGELNLSNVTFVGALPKSQMPEALAASDACIAILQNIPMFRTTFPNKVFDYMAAGKPTVLAIDGVIRNVVEAADAGIFVPPGNHKALAAVVRQLSDNREKAKAMGESARTYVVEHFDRNKHANQFVELIEKLA